MQRKLIILVAIIAIVVVVAASAAWIYPSTLLSEQEKARNAAINYIQTKHTETASLMTNLNWKGGIQDNYLLGAETYSYTAQGWTVNVQYPVVPNPIYTIEASCTSGGVVVDWHGTYQSGAITETSYTYTP